MGSFQQISLGIICLVAAFAFGTYVNNHPSGEIAQMDANGNRMDGDSNRIGNVQSRLKLDDLEPVNKRSAPIATLRDPLPPPSQLSDKARNNSSKRTLSMPNHSQNAAAPSSGLQVPDFSTIAAEFKNTPIELPPMGATPSPSNFANRALPPSSSPTLLNPIAKPETSPRPLDQPNQPPTVGNDAWSIQAESKLSSADFAPKLKDRFSSRPAPSRTSSPTASQPIPSSRKLENSSSAPTQRSTLNQPDHPARIASNFPDALPAATNQLNADPSLSPAARNPNGIRTNEQPSKTVRAKLPFGLTENSRSELARLRSSVDSKIALQTTKFVDHVVQSGETLQSISTRYFGKPDYYLDIYLANRNQLRNPAIVPAGITIKVPKYQ